MKITQEYIQAKNGLLLNVGILVLAIVITLTWYIAVTGSVSRDMVELKEASEIARNVMDLGLVAMSDDDLDSMGAMEVRAKKIQQLQKLFPEARSYVFSDDPADTKRLQDLTLTLVEKPKNVTTSYAKWLRESITPEMDEALQMSQKDFGEVLPVFVSVDPDLEQTKEIVGKVDLENIVQLVEDDLFSSQGIENVQGAFGIRNVIFDEINPDLGYYDIAARVEEIPSARVMSFLEYIGTLGSIQVTQIPGDDLVGIKHLASVPARVDAKATYHSEGRSALSNPLVTVTSLVIEPAGDTLRNTGAPELDAYISLSPRSRFRNWNLIVTLRFYVRGASDDHIQVVESQIASVLNGTQPYISSSDAQDDNESWPLQDRIKNALLADCGGCIEQQQLKQMRSDLDALTTVYTDFELSLTSKDAPDPTERIQTSMQLLDSFLNIRNKIDTLIRKIQS